VVVRIGDWEFEIGNWEFEIYPGFNIQSQISNLKFPTSNPQCVRDMGAETGRVPRMTTGRKLLIASMVSALGGCAQPGPIQSHMTNVRGLKASVSQMEFEKQKLEKRIAELDAKNRELADRVLEEETARDSAISRLDDARREMRKQGIELGDETRVTEREGSGDQTTRPASQSNKKKRKAPFAQIPARIETIPSGESSNDGFDDSSASNDKGERLEFGPQSRNENGDSWVPIARSRGNGTTTSR
jgi:hypothetical protein